MDLLRYWHLNERPFESTWDTRFFYQSRDHDEALNRLYFLVGEQSMGMGMLTGEIGCGKTLTRAVFSERLDPRQFQSVTLENSCFAFQELLAYIIGSLEGIPPNPRTDKFTLFEKLRGLSEKIRNDNRHLVLIFDEAQEMGNETLNELKLLTNFNGGGKNFLSIVLLGQPELRPMVASLPAINQRISLRFHLNALQPDDAGSYLSHRLMVAGHENGEVFEEGAVERVFQAGQGVPRQMNRIAKLALEFAWLREFPMVNLDAVEAVVRDLQRHQNLPTV